MAQSPTSSSSSSMPSPGQQLWDACAAGNLDSVQKLLAPHFHSVWRYTGDDCNWLNPADLDAGNCLAVAVKNRHTAVVEYLLDNCFRLELSNAAFMWAAQNNDEATMRLLLARPRSQPHSSPFRGVLHYCCSHNHHKVLRLLLREEDVDANEVNSLCFTPLFVAIWKKHLESVKLLLACEQAINLTVFQRGSVFQVDRYLSDCMTPELQALLDDYQRNPAQTQAELRRELGW